MGIGGLSRHQLTFPIRKTFMRRSIVSLFSFLAIALIALTGCQEPQNSIPGSVDSISVRVMDSTDAKTITPEGNVNISHYIITVVNEAEGINQSSGYLTKGSMFTVSNVPAGTWYAKVDAYIERGEDTYVKVASDQSEPKTVQAGASTTFELVLDTLDAVASGDVTVTLKMPAALSAESTAFWYQYTITGMTDEEFSLTSEMLSGTTGADGLATITLDADAIGLMQGAYRFAITVQDAETSPTLTRKGMDVMRLVNGLEAKGTIDLTTYEADQSFDVTITDKIGDILTPSLEDGKEVYNLDGQDGSASLTVTLAEPLKANETIEWYVDGELDETVNADEATSGKYTLTFTSGSHIVTAIVRDTNTLMAVGSIEEFEVNLVAAEIAVQMFTFSLNDNGESYTVTGLTAPIGELVMPSSGVLEIPATYKGKPVTEIGHEAFRRRNDIVGSVVIPDGVTSIEQWAFIACPSLTDIYCEAAARPEGWHSSWLYGDCAADVFWGVSRSEYDAIMNNDSVPYDVAEPVVGYDSETVALSCDTSFAHIYYTLDGSEPDKDSTLYTEPFRHIGDFTLKAVAYVGNGIYSDVVTKPLSSVGAGGID